jgi:two-component system, LytTR family, response regulator
MNDTPLHVVIVDDEPQITDLLETYIRSLSGNFSVHPFNDPEEAHVYLLQHSPDVLITDFKMPKFDGIQLMKLMPENSTRILISGYVSEILEGHLRELKAVFLEKPVSLKQLGALIKKAGRPCVR